MGKIKYTKGKSLKIINRTMKLMADGFNMGQIALKLNVPKKSLYRIISNDELMAAFKKKNKAVIDELNIKVAKKSLKSALKCLKDADYKELVLGSAILQDKTYPPTPGLTQYNIDKNVNIKWKGWEQPHSNDDDSV